MLYNNNHAQDILNILEHIDAYTKGIGLQNVPINTIKLRTICERMREEFPCAFGIDKASIFKKAAVFVACFVEENPIEIDAFKQSNLNEHVVDKNPNAIIALDLAFKFMSLAKVTRSDDKVFVIKHGIKMSMHSYYDFLDMLSQDIELKTHFMPLALLFEQTVYKTHKDMQYELVDFAEETEEDIEKVSRGEYIDQEGVPVEWDDYIGFWNTSS